jgi:hypothetical protein
VIYRIREIWLYIHVYWSTQCYFRGNTIASESSQSVDTFTGTTRSEFNLSVACGFHLCELVGTFFADLDLRLTQSPSQCCDETGDEVSTELEIERRLQY